MRIYINFTRKLDRNLHFLRKKNPPKYEFFSFFKKIMKNYEQEIGNFQVFALINKKIGLP